jgi:hypothetical protein
MTEYSKQNLQERLINIRKEESFTVAVCIDSKGKVVPVLNEAPCHEDTGGVERYISMHS